MFEQYANMDFTDAKPVADVPALARLQASQGGKSRITIPVDTATLAVFKARAETGRSGANHHSTGTFSRLKVTN